MTDPLIVAMFEEYCKDLTFAKANGAGYCVYFTDSSGLERAIKAPSGKSLWKKPHHAKSAIRLENYAVEYAYQKLTRCFDGYADRELIDNFWEYAWTIFKIKKAEDPNIKTVIGLLKLSPPDVKGAIDILEKI